MGARDAGRLVLPVLSAAQLLVLLSINIPIVAFPVIGRELGIPSSFVQFVVTAYALAFGSLLLLGGRLADLAGRRRVLIAGLWVFAGSCAVAAVAPSGVVVILARAVQGIGAALVAPAALSLLTTTYAEGRERERALGVFGAATAVGAALGVLLSGVLTQVLGWRSVFAAPLVLALLLAVVAPWVLPSGLPARDRGRLDLPGAASVTAGLALFAFGVTWGGEHGFLRPTAVGAITGGVGLVGFFLVLERRVAAPLLPFRVFSYRNVGGVTLATLFVWAGFASLFFHSSLLMQEVLGYSAIRTGLSYLPLTVATVLAAQVAAPLVARWSRLVIVGGAGLIALGSVLLSQVQANSSYVAQVMPGLLVSGVGLGLSLVALQVAVFMGVPDHDSGIVAGLFNTSQEVASAIGTAVLATVALVPSTLQAGLHVALVAGGVVAVVGGLLGGTATRPSHR